MSTALTLTGLLADIIGALMLSHVYFSTSHWWQLPKAFVLAWTRHRGRAVLASRDINAEDRRSVLRGLALIVAGFGLQGAGALWMLVASP